VSRPTDNRAAWIAFATRLIAGGIFVAFGAGKFLNHGSELHRFSPTACPRRICSYRRLERSSSLEEWP
jgi:hypothetical protein